MKEELKLIGGLLLIPVVWYLAVSFISILILGFKQYVQL